MTTVRVVLTALGLLLGAALLLPSNPPTRDERVRSAAALKPCIDTPLHPSPIAKWRPPMTFVNANLPAIRTTRGQVLSRARWIALFVIGWSLQIVLLSGALGPLMQVVGGVLFVLWLGNMAQLAKAGFLPVLFQFWKCVFTGR